jgi:hypothetical protein
MAKQVSRMGRRRTSIVAAIVAALLIGSVGTATYTYAIHESALHIAAAEAVAAFRDSVMGQRRARNIGNGDVRKIAKAQRASADALEAVSATLDRHNAELVLLNDRLLGLGEVVVGGLLETIGSAVIAANNGVAEQGFLYQPEFLEGLCFIASQQIDGFVCPVEVGASDPCGGRGQENAQARVLCAVAASAGRQQEAALERLRLDEVQATIAAIIDEVRSQDRLEEPIADAFDGPTVGLSPIVFGIDLIEISR